MTDRFLQSWFAVVSVMFFTLGPAVVQGQESAAGTEAAPRTAWGAPDLNGVWDFRTLTPFERPSELADQAFFTEEEAAQFEAGRLAELAVRDDQEPADIVGNYNQLWFDPGEKISETNQTSLVIDPPNGQVPPLTTAAQAKQAARDKAREGVNRHVPTYGGFVGDLGPGMFAVRCILGFNTGPPMTPGGYNQNVQVVQTPDHVVLVNEMVHSSRVVPLDGRPHLPKNVKQWMGDSRGHWEGDTLVIETSNFLRETSFRAGVTTADLSLIEYFTRVADGTLLYEVTVEDPSTWDQPWSYRMAMVKGDDPLYEYACHEGNYGLYNILAGARKQEAAADAAGVPTFSVSSIHVNGRCTARHDGNYGIKGILAGARADDETGGQ